MTFQPHLTTHELHVRDNRPWTYREAADHLGGRRDEEPTGCLFDRLAGVWRSCDDTLVAGRR